MSQESIRPEVVNHLQELPEQITCDYEAEISTLYPYLDDTDKINAQISRDFSFLERREKWRRNQFIKSVRNIGYPSLEILTDISDNSVISSEKARENITKYKFCDESSLAGVPLILNDFEQTDTDVSEDNEQIIDGIINSTVDYDEAESWTKDSNNEEDFRKYIDDFNKRHIMPLGGIPALEDDAQNYPVELSEEDTLQNTEIVIQTEIDIVPTLNVLHEIRTVIETDERYNIRTKVLTFLKKMLGEQK